MNGAALVDKFVDYIINPTILLIFAAGFFLFTWGLVRFLWNLSQGEDNADGKRHMLWGIVGMLIMVSVYGIIAMIDDTFDLNVGNPDVSRINNVTTPVNFGN